MGKAGAELGEAYMLSGSKDVVKGGRFRGVGGGVGVADGGGEVRGVKGTAWMGTRVAGSGTVGRRRG